MLRVCAVFHVRVGGVLCSGSHHCYEADNYRRALLRELDAIKMPGNALDLLVSHFGVDRVAEMTG